jgi:hypothetical protein
VAPGSKATVVPLSVRFGMRANSAVGEE